MTDYPFFRALYVEIMCCEVFSYHCLYCDMNQCLNKLLVNVIILKVIQ